jgi:Transcription termination factor nusG
MPLELASDLASQVRFRKAQSIRHGFFFCHKLPIAEESHWRCRGYAGPAESWGNMLDPESRWFAVHTQPMRERTAQDHLEAQVYRTFLPTRLKTVSHARKLRTIVAPFFPRYLFVVIDLKRQRWRSVNGTVGVASVVMQGDRPQPVPHGVVEAR